jgi:hypothetical protein
MLEDVLPKSALKSYYSLEKQKGSNSAWKGSYIGTDLNTDAQSSIVLSRALWGL